MELGLQAELELQSQGSGLKALSKQACGADLSLNQHQGPATRLTWPLLGPRAEMWCVALWAGNQVRIIDTALAMVACGCQAEDRHPGGTMLPRLCQVG